MGKLRYWKLSKQPKVIHSQFGSGVDNLISLLMLFRMYLILKILYF